MKTLILFLRTPAVLLVSSILLLQAAVFYHSNRGEVTPIVAPLNTLPEDLGPWRLVQQDEISDYTATILNPDDYVLRVYEDPSTRRTADWFVAYFKTQRTGHSPHSPRNCLPGGGWVPNRWGKIQIANLTTAGTFTVNRYLVAKGNDKFVVLYWYQTSNRVVADEYTAKVFLVLDSLRYRRSDTALVRVSVPVADSEDGAERAAIAFARQAQAALRAHIPPISGF